MDGAPVQKAYIQPLFRGGLIAPTAFDVVRQIIFMELMPDMFAGINGNNVNLPMRIDASGAAVASGNNKMLTWYTATSTSTTTVVSFAPLRDGYINPHTATMVSPPGPVAGFEQTAPVPLASVSRLLPALAVATGMVPAAPTPKTKLCIDKASKCWSSIMGIERGTLSTRNALFARLGVLQGFYIRNNGIRFDEHNIASGHAFVANFLAGATATDPMHPFYISPATQRANPLSDTGNPLDIMDYVYRCFMERWPTRAAWNASKEAGETDIKALARLLRAFYTLTGPFAGGGYPHAALPAAAGPVQAFDDVDLPYADLFEPVTTRTFAMARHAYCFIRYHSHVFRAPNEWEIFKPSGRWYIGRVRHMIAQHRGDPVYEQCLSMGWTAGYPAPVLADGTAQPWTMDADLARYFHGMVQGSSDGIELGFDEDIYRYLYTTRGAAKFVQQAHAATLAAFIGFKDPKTPKPPKVGAAKKEKKPRAPRKEAGPSGFAALDVQGASASSSGLFNPLANPRDAELFLAGGDAHPLSPSAEVSSPKRVRSKDAQGIPALLHLIVALERMLGLSGHPMHLLQSIGNRNELLWTDDGRNTIIQRWFLSLGLGMDLDCLVKHYQQRFDADAKERSEGMPRALFKLMEAHDLGADGFLEFVKPFLSANPQGRAERLRLSAPADNDDPFVDDVVRAINGTDVSEFASVLLDGSKQFFSLNADYMLVTLRAYASLASTTSPVQDVDKDSPDAIAVALVVLRNAGCSPTIITSTTGVALPNPAAASSSSSSYTPFTFAASSSSLSSSSTMPPPQTFRQSVASRALLDPTLPQQRSSLSGLRLSSSSRTAASSPRRKSVALESSPLASSSVNPPPKTRTISETGARKSAKRFIIDDEQEEEEDAKLVAAEKEDAKLAAAAQAAEEAKRAAQTQLLLDMAQKKSPSQSSSAAASSSLSASGSPTDGTVNFISTSGPGAPGVQLRQALLRLNPELSNMLSKTQVSHDRVSSQFSLETLQKKPSAGRK